MKYFSYIIMTFVTLLAAGCGRSEDNRILAGAASLADERPEEARVLLDSIDYSSLSAADRHYYDLLRIKTDDKLFVRHSSDSLINTVVDYYASRPNNPHYPEALYYAGRVNHTIGDYPTALAYYHDAIERIPKGKKHDRLRGNILSQTASLLNALRMYSDAIPYAKRVIDLDIASNDTVNLIYDLQLLGALYMHTQRYDSATFCFWKTLRKDIRATESQKLKSRIYKAGIALFMGDTIDALNEIRNTPEKAKGGNRNLALAYAAEIYNASGIPDTAFIYSKKLVESIDPNNKKIGYKLLLTTGLIDRLPSDSLPYYFQSYKDVLEKSLTKNDSISIAVQNSRYNYESQVEKRLKAEKRSNSLVVGLAVCGFVLLVMFVLANILLRQSRIRLGKLRDALDKVSEVEKKLFDLKMEADSFRQESEARKALRERLLKLREQSESESESETEIILPDSLKESNAYQMLITHLANHNPIPHKDPFWSDLRDAVEKSSANLPTILESLSDEKLTPTDLNTVALIRCGLTPSQMVTVTGRTKGTISSRREQLCIKLMGEKLNVSIIDDIIRLL